MYDVGGTGKGRWKKNIVALTGSVYGLTYGFAFGAALATLLF